jgi:hypothetical protein
MRERLLIRHFLRQFVSHDLISPNADRHEVLAVVAAALITLGVFVTSLLALKFQLMLYHPPAVRALAALDDYFLYIAGSMILMALLMVGQWEAVALDARDTSILGLLPVPRHIIARAKLSAILVFAAAFAVALNVFPSVAYPCLLMMSLPIGILGLFRLITAHAVVTIAAGAFGFFAILAFRELLHAALPAEWFRRASAYAQSLLVVGLVTAFLLLPTMSASIATRWLAPGTVLPYVTPPLWFVGLHEAIAGDVIGNARKGMSSRWQMLDSDATSLYRSRQTVLREVAALSFPALGAALLVGLGAFAWNNRRLPLPSAGRPLQPRRIAALLTRLALRVIVRKPLSQAGFCFTLQCLARSAPHRFAMAAAAAVWIVTSTVLLRGTDALQPRDASSVPVAVLAVQTVLVICLLGGFRYAVRMPVERRAAWLFRVAWSRRERPLLAGVKRAAFVLVVMPVLLLVVWHVSVLGLWLAAVHTACGLLLACVLIDAMLLGFRKLPFVSAYEPIGNMRVLLPLVLVASVLFAEAFVWVERLSFSDTQSTLLFVATLVAALVVVRGLDTLQRRVPVFVNFNDAPPEATQRLDLAE